MTKARAVEILNELFDSYLVMEKACLDTIIKVDGKQFALRDKLDEITDGKIALLTAIDALTVKAEPDNGWISVTDELPKLGERVMAFCRAGILTFLRYDGEVWFEMSSRNEYLHSFVTHWQPLPTPPMDEYISKQSVIDYLNGYLNSIGEDGTYSPLFDRGQRRALINSIQDISAIKAADVQPVKHGRWIFQNRHDEDGRCIYHCSKCNIETKVFPCNFIPWQMHEKYCAGCGARMDGDSE